VDQLASLFSRHAVLFGMMCRDPTLTDMELLAQAGCHIVWIDLEHGAVATIEALRLCRTITHLGMVPAARIVELSRTHVQTLLDGGFKILILPQITSAADARRFVDLAKYPPLGNRGVSSTAPGNDFTLGSDPLRALSEANAATHLMVQFEDDRGFEALEFILAIPGIDMITVGPTDWAFSKGLSPAEGAEVLRPKIEKIFGRAKEAGKISAMGISSADQAAYYVGLSARIIFTGIDVPLKRRAFQDSLAACRTRVS
jgi:4-hydroxy-2-oxoheptanedioate aldolase